MCGAKRVVSECKMLKCLEGRAPSVCIHVYPMKPHTHTHTHTHTGLCLFQRVDEAYVTCCAMQEDV